MRLEVGEFANQNTKNLKITIKISLLEGYDFESH